ncbi:hypothetical protein B5E77_09570 [Lachnoclostridium sp. An131]|jgi:uncharacterized phage-like protein YoqJ|uniref:SLOG family protein n=1 Tax=Lachnoclostridium sp. An131 TaxID=1965555 RepID=UPI000B36E8C1|nr:SLOG family protein [Lachnoclostridium sp. An131]OUQ26179.1 hypothetical protein B5E77_09570 [Lachnoclostridium sp. An131]
MANEAELRLHRCCFTGHRPEKLNRSEVEIKKDLEGAILQAIDDGFVTFITGMARGVDIWAGEIILQLRKNNPNLHLIAASPYDGFESRWSADWQRRYKDILDQADLVRFVCNGYSKSCFQIRNEWMVNRSARVIAVYNGEPGGTRNTIEYAERNKVECFKI